MFSIDNEVFYYTRLSKLPSKYSITSKWLSKRYSTYFHKNENKSINYYIKIIVKVSGITSQWNMAYVSCTRGFLQLCWLCPIFLRIEHLTFLRWGLSVAVGILFFFGQPNCFLLCWGRTHGALVAFHYRISYVAWTRPS